MAFTPKRGQLIELEKGNGAFKPKRGQLLSGQESRAFAHATEQKEFSVEAARMDSLSKGNEDLISSLKEQGLPNKRIFELLKEEKVDDITLGKVISEGSGEGEGALSKFGRGVTKSFAETTLGAGQLVGAVEKDTAEELRGGLETEGFAEGFGKFSGTLATFLAPSAQIGAATKAAGALIPGVTKGASLARILAQAGVVGGIDAGIETVRQGEPNVEAAKAGLLAGAFSLAFNPATRGLFKSSPQVDDLAGRIVQGTKADKIKASKALADIDVKGVKSYEELGTSVKTRISDLAAKQDEVLDATGLTFKLEDFAEKIGGGTSQNRVTEALDNLQELYVKTSDPQNAQRIKAILAEGNTSGLTLKEVNQIAREYGQEFGGKAFSKVTGEPLTSVNAQAFENVRSGVKEVVRDKLPDGVAKELDLRMSDLFRTKKLVEKLSEQSNKILQKTASGKFAKLRKAVVSVLDFATFGVPSQFIRQSVDSPGSFTLNALELEQQLPGLLKQLEKATASNSPTAMAKILGELSPQAAAAGISD